MHKKPNLEVVTGLDHYESGNLALDKFVELLTEPLTGLVDDDERDRFRTETLVHLEMLIERFERQGLDHEAATRRAIGEYGQPEEGADEYLNSWLHSIIHSPLTQKVGYGNLVALAWFAFAQLFYVILMQLRLFFPTDSWVIPFKPSDVRAIWPAPLPYPEVSWSFGITVLYPVLIPLIAAWMCGRMIPIGAARCVYHALLPIILYSFIMGALMLPVTDGLLYGLFQVFYWLPVGCLVAHLSSTLARKSRLRSHNYPKSFGGQ